MPKHLGKEIFPTNRFRAEVREILESPDSSRDPRVANEERLEQIMLAAERLEHELGRVAYST